MYDYVALFYLVNYLEIIRFYFWIGFDNCLYSYFNAWYCVEVDSNIFLLWDYAKCYDDFGV